MEQQLSSKMEELLCALDQVKKYREIAASMIDLAIILSATTVAVLVLVISGNLWTNFNGVATIPENHLPVSALVGNGSILLIIAGITGAILRVTLRVNAVKVGQWKSILNEGVPGAIKLLDELKWQTIFNDIRSAKLGLSLYGFLKAFLIWVLGDVILFLYWDTLVKGYIIHLSVNPLAIMIASLVLALALSNKDLRKRYEQVGHLDSLLWELRWFDSEFRRADFKT